MRQRTSGILLHPTSLANLYPIGDLGPAAIGFVDFMVQSGQRWWQMLPIGPAGTDDSPYDSLSAFAGNPLLISPDRLMEQGFLNRRDTERPIAMEVGRVNYSFAARWKLPVLKKAFGYFEAKACDRKQSDLEEFTRQASYWLDDFSLFSAIQENEVVSGWTRWDQDLRTRQPDALINARKQFARDVRYHQFIQWQFSVQWNELMAYCSSQGIGLIGDIPMFVADQSADVWAHPELFKLDVDGKPTVVAGVPPDRYAKTGQLWGLPVYRWDALQEQNYKWWIERLRTAFGRFDFIRLDHFIGFVRTYEVPAQAKTALCGQYQPGGGAAFFRAVHQALGSLPLIADALGTPTPEVSVLLDQLQIPDIRVLQFEYGTQLQTNSATPVENPVNSVVYTGTHDNDTTAGWYRKLPGAQRDALQKRLGVGDQGIVWAMIRQALASQADAAVVPAQDLLELGTETRMNVPGIAKGNWSWRLREGELSAELARKLRGITILYRSGKDHPGLWHQRDNAIPEIAKRAYELYVRGGRQNGHPDQDWLSAERELQVEAKK
ncbi:4-alpha-glucanotransferase [Fimbriiglobus ruber]|uniref:4-alpha-glucanotransferase n=1 Tax=Fimbriiglobus ruber TaxID=1908690 RepID=A0A225DRM0_9BACT|nr:4-alpha-glucanotransferase [Fimbriiglobus ruber]OWK39789.1 4-alpha-glucanotransferase [Fimbriiglobus ruber]